MRRIISGQIEGIEPFSILDVSGNVVNEEAMPKLSDEQLRDLMKKWFLPVFGINVQSV